MGEAIMMQKTVLPSFISAMSGGSFTPASDITGEYSIDTNLGVFPKVVILYTNEYNSTTGTGDGNYGVSFVWVQDERQNSQQAGSLFFYSVKNGYSASGRTVTTNNGIRVIENNRFVGTYVSGSTALKAGITYHWIVWA